MRWLVLLFGLEVPALLALIDCTHRAPEEFEGGRDDQRAWTKWLWVAVAGAWMLWGNGIVLGYYYSVVKRHMPMAPYRDEEGHEHLG